MMPSQANSSSEPPGDLATGFQSYQSSASTSAVKLHEDRRPAARHVHLALITAQVLFGGGSVVGKLGVESFNPMMFALIREVRRALKTFDRMS